MHRVYGGPSPCVESDLLDTMKGRLRHHEGILRLTAGGFKREVSLLHSVWPLRCLAVATLGTAFEHRQLLTNRQENMSSRDFTRNSLGLPFQGLLGVLAPQGMGGRYGMDY